MMVSLSMMNGMQASLPSAVTQLLVLLWRSPASLNIIEPAVLMECNLRLSQRGLARDARDLAAHALNVYGPVAAIASHLRSLLCVELVLPPYKADVWLGLALKGRYISSKQELAALAAHQPGQAHSIAASNDSDSDSSDDESSGSDSPPPRADVSSGWASAVSSSGSSMSCIASEARHVAEQVMRARSLHTRSTQLHQEARESVSKAAGTFR
jgi:hypothetical protein